MTDHKSGLKFDQITPDVCPVCDSEMTKGKIAGWPVYICKNPECKENPTYIRWENPKKVEFDKASIHVTLVGGGYETPTYRAYYCTLCNSPMEIIDYGFCICNCPNCCQLGHGSIMRYFGEYTGLELPEQRVITHFLDVDSLYENPRKEGVE